MSSLSTIVSRSAALTGTPKKSSCGSGFFSGLFSAGASSAVLCFASSAALTAPRQPSSSAAYSAICSPLSRCSATCGPDSATMSSMRPGVPNLRTARVNASASFLLREMERSWPRASPSAGGADTSSTRMWLFSRGGPGCIALGLADGPRPSRRSLRLLDLGDSGSAYAWSPACSTFRRAWRGSSSSSSCSSRFSKGMRRLQNVASSSSFLKVA
mmetsp:Transcript_26168/g.65783  ORF Transcript_26168/g.65783 Transcript_26168/m.65783 type:complete len:214 (+) Transcript_26168:1634-2275(+)